MLLVKTRIEPSPIHGLGLFADRLIPAGAEVWRFLPGFDLEKTPEEVSAMPAIVQAWFKRFGYLDYHLGCYIVSVDDARFINHSDHPNINQDYTIDRYGVDIALRDIKPGEEITTDYRLIEKVNWLSDGEKGK
jgi:uncharacterized protein